MEESSMEMSESGLSDEDAVMSKTTDTDEDWSETEIKDSEKACSSFLFQEENKTSDDLTFGSERLIDKMWSLKENNELDLELDKGAVDSIRRKYYSSSSENKHKTPRKFTNCLEEQRIEVLKHPEEEEKREEKRNLENFNILIELLITERKKSLQVPLDSQVNFKPLGKEIYSQWSRILGPAVAVQRRTCNPKLCLMHFPDWGFSSSADGEETEAIKIVEEGMFNKPTSRSLDPNAVHDENRCFEITSKILSDPSYVCNDKQPEKIIDYLFNPCLYETHFVILADSDCELRSCLEHLAERWLYVFSDVHNSTTDGCEETIQKSGGKHPEQILEISEIQKLIIRHAPKYFVIISKVFFSPHYVYNQEQWRKISDFIFSICLQNIQVGERQSQIVCQKIAEFFNKSVSVFPHLHAYILTDFKVLLSNLHKYDYNFSYGCIATIISMGLSTIQALIPPYFKQIAKFAADDDKRDFYFMFLNACEILIVDIIESSLKVDTDSVFDFLKARSEDSEFDAKDFYFECCNYFGGTLTIRLAKVFRKYEATTKQQLLDKFDILPIKTRYMNPNMLIHCLLNQVDDDERPNKPVQLLKSLKFKGKCFNSQRKVLFKDPRLGYLSELPEEKKSELSLNDCKYLKTLEMIPPFLLDNRCKTIEINKENYLGNRCYTGDIGVFF